MPLEPSLSLYIVNALCVWLLLWLIATTGRSALRLVRLSLMAAVFLIDAALMLWVHCAGVSVAYLALVLGVAATTFPAHFTSGLSLVLGPRRFWLYLASVFTTTALFYVYLPITTFLTSPGELSIHLDYLITNNAKAAIVVLYVASALYALVVSPRLKSMLTLLAVAVVVVSLVYAFIVPFGYPIMNGLMFEQIAIPRLELFRRALLDMALVPALFAFAAWVVHTWGGARVLTGLALINVSLAATAGVTVAKDRADTGAEASTDAHAPVQPIRLAKDKNNVLIIFLDRFMGGFVEEILQDEPKLNTTLEGFTWYPRTLAPGQNSLAGIHALLGGYDYTPTQMNKRHRLLRDMSVESFALLPQNFTRKGYAASLVSPRGLGFTVEGDCSFVEGIKGLSCSPIPASVTAKLAQKHNVSMNVLADSLYADLLVLLGVMRGTPYMVRAVVHERGPWRPFLDHSAGTTFKQWAELKSLPELTRTDAQESNLNIFFNMLPHEPYFMGEDCVPQAKRLKAPRKARKRGHVSTFSYQHYVAARCALRIVGDYMQWLRDEGVYDNTKIVIVSDHGIVGKVEDRSSRAVAGGTTDNKFVRSRSVLLVKERNARGPLQTSEQYLPNAEVPRIVCEEIGGCVNPYLNNKTIEAHGRDVPFYVDFVPWQFNRQEPKRFVIQSQMVLTKPDPYDIHAWQGQASED